MRSLVGPSMEDLPEHVLVDILSRLPVKTIVHCKCVCKKWRNIVFDSYFAHLQLLRSPASLMVHPRSRNPGILKWVEVENEVDYHDLHHDPVMSLDLNLAPVFQNCYIVSVGSVNGLICLLQLRPGRDYSYICNPITREYMILPTPRQSRDVNITISYGFGIGSVTREYKVIRILQGKGRPTSTSVAEVYTIGTGQWRSLRHVPYLPHPISNYGTFLNGHAHWSVFDNKKIYAFDFDTETYELFPSPPVEESHNMFQTLGVVKGCLCRCDADGSELRIWVMKEYGIKKSWHKDVIIKQGVSPNLDLLIRAPVYLIEGLKDGTILMISNVQKMLLAYCPRTKTAVDTKLFDRYCNGLAYRPSFHRLHNFENERVHVFQSSTIFL